MSNKKKILKNDEDWDTILDAEIEANKSLIIEETVQIEPELIIKEEKKKDNKKKKNKIKTDVIEPKKELSAAAKIILLRQKQITEEEERIKKIQYEEDMKIREEEEKEATIKKKIEDDKERKKKAKKDKINREKAAGTYMTKTEKEKNKIKQIKLEALLNSQQKIIKPYETFQEQLIANEELIIKEELIFRSPIICIMGHVDTGKTSLLDNIRNTNVQKGEAGGITQQIGATLIPYETLVSRIHQPFDINIPNLLVIDTPGHEAFSNLRDRGSSICDIAIVVIDLMHSLENQTIESINMLKECGTTFIVALNKIDRCYGWVSDPNIPIEELIKQNNIAEGEFNDKTRKVILNLNEQGLNVKLNWENNFEDTISLCPTSAKTGDGLSDLLMTLINISQTTLKEKITFKESIECTVLEVKNIDGLGSTIDVILINGTLKEGMHIVVSTLGGPIITTIRSLLTPPPNHESRLKNDYIRHKEIKGAAGIKIVANNISQTIAGSPIIVVDPNDDEAIQKATDNSRNILKKSTQSLEIDSTGVIVHASSLGSLEALIRYLRKECNPPIPIGSINIGTIYKKDIMFANLMNEKNKPEFAIILAFDVEIHPDAAKMAEELKVNIFTADIIYHLFKKFTDFMNELILIKKKESEEFVVFPVVLKILPKCIFNKKDPIIIGVQVVEGTLRLNTPLSIPSLNLDLGIVTSIQENKKDILIAKKGMEVAISIRNDTLTYDRQFSHKDLLYSKISRKSIDVLKEFYKDEVTKEKWKLIIKLKEVFGIN